MNDPTFEDSRLQALRQLKLLDTPPSESFDRITRMASRVFDLPIAAVSLTDHDRQWFKSRVGVEHWHLTRHKAPCAEVAETAGSLVIPDLLESEQYRDSPLAQSGIRFYAAAPLVTRDGFGLGAMCVLGTEPREISPDEQTALVDLAAMVMAQIELQHAFGRVEPVSGLPNRHQFLDDLRDQARDDPGGLRSVVIAEAADTTRLREALRVLGPSAIDDLIRQSTRMLQSTLGPGIDVYQVGQTQFAWLIGHRDEEARTQALCKVREGIAAFLASNTLPALANPVFGIAPFRLGEVEAEDILRTAHNAAQDARNADLPVSIYSEAADDHHRRRFRLLADMRHALAADDQLSLVYQPRVSLLSGACVGAEALLRWRHPLLGDVSPGEFIPMVESTDLARFVTDWVTGAAVRQLEAWQADGIDLPVSINVSACNLEEQNFAVRFVERMTVSGLPEGAIEVEVTESAVIRDGTRVGQQLQHIRDAGIRVAIDDFGTGYSSLSYLQNIPADIVKIDQSFIRNLGDNERGRTLVRSMIEMAKGLGFHVVAEGVENEVAYELLRGMGCDEAQGYLISRPVPAADLTRWLKATAHPRFEAA